MVLDNLCFTDMLPRSLLGKRLMLARASSRVLPAHPQQAFSTAVDAPSVEEWIRFEPLAREAKPKGPPKRTQRTGAIALKVSPPVGCVYVCGRWCRPSFIVARLGCWRSSGQVGMIGVYDTWGQRHTCTVLQVWAICEAQSSRRPMPNLLCHLGTWQLDNCHITQVKMEETDGYTGLQQGAGEKKLKRVIKPEQGHLDKAGVPPKRKLWEFRVSPDAVVPAGR